MGPARIYPWRKIRRSRAPSIAPGTFFVARPWADCITNMPGFSLRQAQPAAAQIKLDMNKITCGDWLGYGPADRDFVRFFMSGYYNAAASNDVLDYIACKKFREGYGLLQKAQIRYAADRH
jgi:hypothetical protein